MEVGCLGAGTRLVTGSLHTLLYFVLRVHDHKWMQSGSSRRRGCNQETAVNMDKIGKQQLKQVSSVACIDYS